MIFTDPIDAGSCSRRLRAPLAGVRAPNGSGATALLYYMKSLLQSGVAMKRFLLVALATVLAPLLVACANSSEAPSDEAALTWPSASLSSSVPELKGIRITNIAETANGVDMAFDGCDSNDTKGYIEALKSEGWDIETANTEDGKTVTAKMQSEVLIFLSSEDSSGSISYSRTD
jgi:hypothetical protein